MVIGAGHCGLATSYFLDEHSIDHVLLERGRVANSWRSERWDSLRLLTPNWQSRLPGHAYDGDNPDGFMTMPEVVDFIGSYSESIAAPVHRETTVQSVRPSSDGYDVLTSDGEWRCRSVVLANGACSVPDVPALRDDVPPHIDMITPLDYREPGRLADGGVLVVGASATGLQLAEEIHRSGRSVTLAVGAHVRMPRVYRGLDILWWMDAVGLLDERYDEVDDIVRARSVPSPQLVGTPERSNLDLNALTDIGVELVGRLAAVRHGTALFSGSLKNQCSLADLKMGRLLRTIDEWATENGHDSDVGPSERYAPTRVSDSPPLKLDLSSGSIRTIVWATGFRPDYSWLDVPVLDRKGRLRHDGGIVAAPGMYAMGLNFLRRRKSSFIHGAEDDARELTAHLAGFLHGSA